MNEDEPFDHIYDDISARAILLIILFASPILAWAWIMERMRKP